MQSKALTPNEYIESLPTDRKEPMVTLRNAIRNNLPDGFQEEMSYGMIGYVVSQSIYPDGYHINPKLPLPFINLASQKNYIALYHSGIYADKQLLDWFKTEYAKTGISKLDMGKSCIRFKKMDEIPVKLIIELAKKMTPQTWIDIYEKAIRKK